MSLIRLFGPAGPALVRQYTRNRLADMCSDEREMIEEYIYHISAQPGSGEYALSRILHPNAWAKVPLCDRVKDLKMPTTFIYGTEDWMEYQHAMKAVQNMTVQSRIIMIQNAGHHLQFDNPEGFNNAVVAELQEKAPGPLSVPHCEYYYLNER